MSFAATVFRRLPLGTKAKRPLKLAYFSACAALGVVRSPALSNLDRLVEPFLPSTPGMFLEVGGNDGLTQSNTWYFEKYKGWRGLLVEPVPYLADFADRCRSAPTARVALGSSDEGFLEIQESGETTTADPSRFTSSGPRLQVPVRRLSSVLDDHGIDHIDFFSLDVEGFEVEVLKGLDLHRHRPSWILVETADIGAVLAQLSGAYVVERQLTHHDHLLRAVRP